MADPVVATAPAVATPAPAAAPAVPAKSAEEKFAARKAEWVEKQKAKDAEAAAPVQAPAVEAKVDMDPETLAKLTEASEKARAANKRADDEQKLGARQGNWSCRPPPTSRPCARR